MPNDSQHLALLHTPPSGDGGTVPKEALLLAMVEQLGRLAGAFLREAGFVLGEQGACGLRPVRRQTLRPVATGPSALPMGPVQALRELLERYVESPTNGRSAPQVSPQPVVNRRGPAAKPTSEELLLAASLLRQYWADRPPVSVLERYGEQVDVSTPQGRWELLVLAILSAAPLPRFRVEETFCALRRFGLLEFQAVCRGGSEWARSVDEVMETTYRGRVRRVERRERLQQAAAILQERFQGDLNRLWEHAQRQPDAAVQLVRSHFHGLARSAAWLVREMGRLGQWPEAHRHPAVQVTDSYVRKVLVNLGIASPSSPVRVVQTVVNRHFRGESWVLFSHGKDRCGRRSLGVCLRHCPITNLCRAWRRWARASAGAADSTREVGQEKEERHR